MARFLISLLLQSPALKQQLADSYFNLVQQLRSSKWLPAGSPHVQSSILALCNIDLTPADLTELSRVSIVSFVAPLLAVALDKAGKAGLSTDAMIDAVTSTPEPAKDATAAATDAKDAPAGKKATVAVPAPWNIRFSAWSLFRLLSYVASAVASAEPGARELGGSLFDEMWKQVCKYARVTCVFAELKRSLRARSLVNLREATLKQPASERKDKDAKPADAAAASASPAASTEEQWSTICIFLFDRP